MQYSITTVKNAVWQDKVKQKASNTRSCTRTHYFTTRQVN